MLLCVCVRVCVYVYKPSADDTRSKSNTVAAAAWPAQMLNAQLHCSYDGDDAHAHIWHSHAVLIPPPLQSGHNVCACTCSIYVHHKFAIYSCIVYILFAAYARSSWGTRVTFATYCLRWHVCMCVYVHASKNSRVPCTYFHTCTTCPTCSRATIVGRLCSFARAEATGKPRNLTNPMEWSIPKDRQLCRDTKANKRNDRCRHKCRPASCLHGTA